jgi:hypothetical protein
MGDQQLEAAIVGLKEGVYLKDVITDLIPVPTDPTILFQKSYTVTVTVRTGPGVLDRD